MLDVVKIETTIWRDLSCFGILDNIKIWFTLKKDDIDSIRNKLNKYTGDVINNITANYKENLDEEELFLKAFNNFYWEPFSRILNALIRKESTYGEFKDEQYIRDEIENERLQAIDKILDSIRGK